MARVEEAETAVEATDETVEVATETVVWVSADSAGDNATESVTNLDAWWASAQALSLSSFFLLCDEADEYVVEGEDHLVDQAGNQAVGQHFHC